MRILYAAAVYFGIVFAVGLVFGPARVFWLEPVLGQTIAVLIEMPFLLVAMVFAAHLVPRWIGLGGGLAARLGMGFLALALQQLADLSVGFGLRGVTLGDQIAYFSTPAGLIYAGALVLFALMPVIVSFGRGAVTPPDGPE